MDVAYDIAAVDDQAAAARHPQGRVQRRPVLGEVDVLAGEHRIAPLGDARLPGERREERERLVRDPLLGVVEREPGGLGDQPLAPAGVGREEFPQMHAANLGVMALERLPGVPFTEHRAMRHDDGQRYRLPVARPSDTPVAGIAPCPIAGQRRGADSNR